MVYSACVLAIRCSFSPRLNVAALWRGCFVHPLPFSSYPIPSPAGCCAVWIRRGRRRVGGSLLAERDGQDRGESSPQAGMPPRRHHVVGDGRKVAGTRQQDDGRSRGTSPLPTKSILTSPIQTHPNSTHSNQPHPTPSHPSLGVRLKAGIKSGHQRKDGCAAGMRIPHPTSPV